MKSDILNKIAEVCKEYVEINTIDLSSPEDGIETLETSEGIFYVNLKESTVTFKQHKPVEYCTVDITIKEE